MLNDLRFACRALAKSKGFTLVAVLTLAFGIGMNTAIFSGVYSFLWAPFPYAEAGNIVSLAQTNPSQGLQEMSISYRDGEDWRSSGSLESIALYRFQMLALNAGGEPANVSGVATTPELLRLLRVSPVLGRDFDDAPRGGKEDRVVIITDGLWRRQFAADRNIVGRELRMDDGNYVVIGVLPPDFTFLYSDADLFFRLYLTTDAKTDRGNRRLSGIARIRRAATIPQAQAEIQAISARLEREAPLTNQGWSGKVTALNDKFIPRDARLASHTALLAVGFVLLIACANIANLLLARGALRRKELAIRASLGAGRMVLIRLLLAESMALALMGALLGVLFAYWGMPILKGVAPPDTPRLESMRLNVTALLYTLGLSLLTGLAAGVAPALLLSHSEPSAALRGGARGNSGRQGLVKLLVVAQVAMAVVLLAASGLAIRSVEIQVNASPGFDTRNLLIARVMLPASRYPARPQIEMLFEQVLHNLRTNARVIGAAAADNLPLSGSGSSFSISIEGRAGTDTRDRNIAGRNIVTPGYFRTLGVRLLEGRDFDGRDRAETQAVALVNETMARRFWTDAANAVGRRFQFEDPAAPNRWITVIGVVSDVRNRGVARPAQPDFFLPHAQSPARAMTLIARTAGSPSRLAGDLRAAVSAADRDQPLRQIESLEDMLARRVASTRALAQILGFLSGVALLLAAIGIYGVMAYMTNQRAREIGVRMALGAQRAGVFRMVLSSGLWLVASGLAIGLPCAYAITPLLRSLLAGLQPHDWPTFAAVLAILVAIAMLACSLPARRATRVDPTTTLRVE